MIPNDTIDKLALVYSSVSDFGTGVTEDEWALQSQLPGWTVKDNLSHMVGTEAFMLGEPPITHTAPKVDWTRNPIGEANENEVDMRRPWTGARVLAEWNDVTTRRLAQLRGADDEYFDAPAMNPTGMGTLADFLHIRVMDLWVHEQDMRRVLGRPGHRGGPVAEHSIDRLIRTVPIVVGKRASTPEGATVLIRVTGGVNRVVATTVRDGRAHTSVDVPETTICDIDMDSDVFLQLATGRGDADDLADQCRVTGDAAHARRVLTQFNMMI